MKISQVDRSTGWLGLALGIMFLAWSLPSLWASAFDRTATIAVKSIQLTGSDAVIAAGILATFGIILAVSGLAVLLKNGHKA